MSDLGFLALGYGLIWVIISIYLWFTGSRQAALKRQLEELRLDVEEAAGKDNQEQ